MKLAFDSAVKIENGRAVVYVEPVEEAKTKKVTVNYVVMNAQGQEKVVGVKQIEVAKRCRYVWTYQCWEKHQRDINLVKQDL